MVRASGAAIALASLVTEGEWMRQVTDLAELLGWSWAHFRPARTERGWRTPVSGPLGAGFVDLILVRDRVIFAELKREVAQLTPPQRAVHERLRAAGVELYTWRPSDLGRVGEVLR